MTAIDIACRACASQPGENCRRDGVLSYVFHAERIEDAASMPSSAEDDVALTDAQRIAAVDGAVDAMGLD